MINKKNTNDQWGIKSAGVHIIAVENCTNSCEFCSTSAPFAGKQSYSASSFFPWLDRLFGDTPNPFKDTYIAITGGEPFLHDNIFLFIDEMKKRYPLKKVGVTTNFYWASETKIRDVAPLLKSLGDILISKYPSTVSRIGGEEKFDELVLLLKYLCPHLDVEVTPMINTFIKWDFHTDRQAVLNACCTAFCYMLKADGKLFRCSLAYGLAHRPEYGAIQDLTPERYFDLSKGLDGFSEWSSKYPIDLCQHCTFWKHEFSVWKNFSE
ncbi:MAG: 4Fe-4S cluster-binding domain-containing protein [Deltaproteobacteria bacterium]|nr:4Fe-4S cluster-binding domain-containing protein [Deltaproteobacteria bacterium]